MKYHLNSPVSTVLPAVLARLRAGSISGEDVIGILVAVSEVAAEKMGGTSGALYS
jgi:dihydroxyacetone kinase